jgi:3-methylfumaryl-CoA hydratase
VTDVTESPKGLVRPKASLDPSTVKVGDRLPGLEKSPTTQQLVKYAGASYDFYQIHYDTAFAEASGLPGVIVHGLLKAGFLGQLLTDWGGPDAFVRRLDVSYRGMDRPDAIYRLEGEVTAVTTGDDGVTVIDADIWGENAEGTKTTLGKGTLEIS